MKNKILCIGEALVDIYTQDNQETVASGGAPFNVACSLGFLKAPVYFYGAIGADKFGSQLLNTLKDFNVQADYIQTLADKKTTAARVSLDEHGERSFVFDRGADDAIKMVDFQNSFNDFGLIHFGSATGLIAGNLYEVYKKLLQWSIKQNIKISFDPNFRDVLWLKNREEFITKAMEFFLAADFVKFSEEELAILFSGANNEERIKQAGLLNSHALICVTLGEQGTLCFFKNKTILVKAKKVKAVDTTGAGDAFAAMILKQLSEISDWESIDLDKIISKSNHFGSQAVLYQGALEFLDKI